jgi:Rrf2 family protein
MLQQTAVHALRVMAYIAEHDHQGPVQSREIAAETGVPRNYLSKIANRLVQAGLLMSARGTNGGFTLARPAAEISLKEVAGLFMDLGSHERCFLHQRWCDGTCRLHQDWSSVAAGLRSLLQNRTIDQLKDTCPPGITASTPIATPTIQAQ